MIRVLVVEDQPDYVDALTVALTAEGFEIDAAKNGREGLDSFREKQPDVVLLDLMLPGIGGLDVLRAVRDVAQTPVIVLSAKDAEADVVTALELGADDYLTKPYSIRELVARIRVALRKMDQAADDVLTLGIATLDPGRYELRLDDVRLDLRRKEFEVLRMLMERPDRIVSRETLLNEVWGIHWTDSKTLDQHIRRLRRKLETAEGSPTIETVRGVGYRIAE